MKRIFTLLTAVASLWTFFTSCEKETVLTVDQTSLSITDAGGSQTVSLTANKPWSVSSSQSWCKVSPTGGEEAASSRISISCDANTTYDERNCAVTFTCAEKTVTVNVSQAANQGLIVGQTSFELTKAAQKLEIPVQANVKFSVEVAASCKDWIKYSTTKGLTTSTVVLDISENKSYDSREGKVTIKQDGGSLSSAIVIMQSQLDGLFLSTSEYNLSNEKHTLVVEVKSNIDFEVMSEVDWIKHVETKGLSTNQIVLEVKENDTFDSREGRVIVRQKNGILTGYLTIIQDEKYGIVVSLTEYNLTSEAQAIDVEVKYNVDFDIVIPNDCLDWIKLVKTRGFNRKYYTFSIAENKSFDNREGSITFKQKNGASCGTVYVKQSQNNGLFVSQSNFTVSEESQTISVEVMANIDFDVMPDADWVKVIDTKGLKQSIVTLSVDENTSADSRACKVIVIQKGGDLKGTITISQSGLQGGAIIGNPTGGNEKIGYDKWD